MHAYENEVLVETTETNQVVALDFLGECQLRRVAILRLDNAPLSQTSGSATSGSIHARFFNRNFTGPSVPVGLVKNNAGFAQFSLSLPVAVRAGDVVIVHNCPVSAYNGMQRVTQKIDDQTVVTDTAYTVAASAGGTFRLDIPEGEQSLYEFMPALDGADAINQQLDVPFVNRDPRLNLNIGVVRKMYVMFFDPGTYKIALAAQEASAAGA